MTEPIAVIDFFSGCGGTSLGLRAAGMKIVAGLDNDHDASETFKRNFPEARFLEADICELNVGDVKPMVPSDHRLLLAGCAPCQPFSKQNRASRDYSSGDERRALLLEFQKFVVGLRPHFVVVENVPGLQNVEGGGPFAVFTDTLNKMGYSIEWRVLSALRFGVPQVRRRLVLVAARDQAVAVPQPTHGPGLRRSTVVRDFMSNLPPLKAGGRDLIDPDHAAMNLSDVNLKRIAATPEGGGRSGWPSELILDCHRDHDGHSDVYGRLAWDKPAAAITTRCLSYSNGRFGHPSEDRAISLREAACLQTFPRSFRFSGSLQSKGRQVGNAVPPLMAQAIGESFLAT